MAEFERPEALVRVAQALRKNGCVDWNVYTPYPIHALESCLGLRRSGLPRFVLVFSLMGAAAGMLLQWWASAVAYPLVVSGKPLFSWPAFIPISFECAILGGAFGAFCSFLLRCGLPQLHHPLFSSSRFEEVSNHRFFLSISLDSPDYDSATELVRRHGGVLTEEPLS